MYKDQVWLNVSREFFISQITKCGHFTNIVLLYTLYVGGYFIKMHANEDNYICG